MATTLTVLGSCGAWSEAGRACSGVLLDADAFRVVIDLGYGTASRLFHALGSTSGDGLDAVVITHRHPDHMVDLHALFRARWFASRNSPPLPVYAAVGVREQLVSMDEPDDGANVDRIFAFNPLPGNYTVGPLTLSALDLPDHVPNSGVRIAFRDLTIAYTGDAGPSEALAELAAGGQPPAGRGERPPPATRGPALTDFGVSPEWGRCRTVRSRSRRGKPCPDPLLARQRPRGNTRRRRALRRTHCARRGGHGRLAWLANLPNTCMPLIANGDNRFR
ncbi:MAG TPA: MBL fold metallo-hydrolase [Tetrasphaera sp.]|nr:MBL fold metallo-hydrolase [Tetrasphaera sp.]